MIVQRLISRRQSDGPRLMAAFTLAHLSDPHLPPLPAPRLRDSRASARSAISTGRATATNTIAARCSTRWSPDMQAQTPDHIAVTGDLVNLALEAEFAPARAWLESVGPPDRVTVIPGNHDAYVRATQHRFAEASDDYLRGDDARRWRRHVSVRCAGAGRWR